MNWEEFDVVLVGPKAIGKSALAIRKVKKVFFDRYNIPSDDEEEFRSTVSLEQGGRKYHLNILVPPGGMEVQESWMRHGVIVVYAIDNGDSFVDVQNYKNIIDGFNKEYALVLVGNKCDKEAEGRREVTTEQGQFLAAEWGCPFYETSAKCCVSGVSTTVDQAFCKISQDIHVLHIKAEKTNSKSKCSVM